MFALIQRHTPMMRLASVQFMSLAAIGIAIPYINLYLVDANFSATFIGTLSSIGAILALSITPWLNHVADQRLLHRRLFMFYMLLMVLANVIFANFTSQALLILAALIFPMSIGPSLTLGMQLTMNQIADRADSIFGQIRSFAALGFAAAGLLAGRLFSWGGYPLLFWVGAIFSFITMQAATIFPAKSESKVKNKPKTKTKRHRGFYVLLVSQFFVTMGLRNSFAFLFIYFADSLDITTSGIGLWAAFLAGIEVPFFVLADRFLPKVQSKWAYIIGIMGMSLFLFALGITQNWMIVLLLLLFRGLAFPIFQLSSFTIVSEISEKQGVATNQAILHVTMPNIALLLTGSLFGWLYDHTGSFIFFTACAVACLIGALVVIVFQAEFDHPDETHAANL